jgi:hypothetical protein
MVAVERTPSATRPEVYGEEGRRDRVRKLKVELLNTSDLDWVEAREWISLFLIDAVVRRR